jgi:hypothetical protein
MDTIKRKLSHNEESYYMYYNKFLIILCKVIKSFIKAEWTALVICECQHIKQIKPYHKERGKVYSSNVNMRTNIFQMFSSWFCIPHWPWYLLI